MGGGIISVVGVFRLRSSELRACTSFVSNGSFSRHCITPILEFISSRHPRPNSSGCRNGLTNPSDEELSLRDILAMDGMLLVGMAEMDDASKLSFVLHCVDGDNWARNGKKRKAVAIMGGTEASQVGVVSSVAASAGDDGPSSGTTTPGRASAAVAPDSFRVLVPGVDGARTADCLVGKSFVIAGTFPEAGNSDELGVSNVKAMIQSFGGDVITRFSKKSSECNTSLGYVDVLRQIVDNRKAHVCIFFG
jgi:hypothetical protein